MIYVNEKIKNLYRVSQPEGRGKYIRLDQNENPNGLPKWLFNAVMEKVTPEFLSIYPECSIPISKYANMHGLKKQNVTFTDGSVVGMGYIIKVFGEPGKDILCVTPSFAMYEVYAKMVGMNVRQLTYEKDFSYNIDNTLNSIGDKTGIVVLVNPNMPVGNAYSREEIISVIEKASMNNAIVIIDEAYYYYYDETSIDLINKYNNVFVLRTFSKMLSIPSLRLGVIMSSSDNIHYINNYIPPYTVNSIALLFAETIVDNHEKLIMELLQQYNEGKEYIVKALANNNYTTLPSKGCYVAIKPKVKSSKEITDLLKKNGILILCGKDGLTGWLRLTIAQKKYMERFMETLLMIDKG